MSETPGAHLEEEPQTERGPQGSRDTGSDEPSGGPVDRPAGTADEKSDTSVLPQKSSDPDAPDLPTGR
ncbi:hypothetical protein SAMN05661080_01700 [Modestobacter sp. DSM 44400]|uniref:hypothetical protein n=1 Tax=Modestobacter sp. DSM 44400 TaxID=1550230 RepID=UPI00089A817C|nr:hypothetical protein [Modestobacter sp. DSM 44400]SDX91434.1 hypothetical protein SAMN05661080_01700 [Modestobacter sp. DSM 44400]